MMMALPARAQTSLSTAVTLALNNSPRIKVAMDDLRRARAVVSEAKDAYVPNLVVGGGAGDSYGITLSVPTIFTATAQSLIYNGSQRFYLRSSRLSLQAALLALQDVREQVEEDAVLAYLDLDNALQRSAGLRVEYAEASTLMTIVQKRFDAGLETELDLNLVRRQLLAIRLQQLQVDDETAVVRQRLSALMGTDASTFVPVSGSIPEVDTEHLAQVAEPATVAERSAAANAQSREQRAKGDASYRWRPQIGFAAQYGRISPINNVSDYYNLHGKYNVGFIGLQIQLPLFDAAHQARSEQAAADASRAGHELEITTAQQHELRMRAQHALTELTVRTQIAEVDLAIAEAQLRATSIKAAHGGYSDPVLNPKDEQNARLKLRQQSLDVLDARFQMRKAQVSMLRLTDGLEPWLQGASLLNAPPAHRIAPAAHPMP